MSVPTRHDHRGLHRAWLRGYSVVEYQCRNNFHMNIEHHSKKEDGQFRSHSFCVSDGRCCARDRHRTSSWSIGHHSNDGPRRNQGIPRPCILRRGSVREGRPGSSTIRGRIVQERRTDGSLLEPETVVWVEEGNENHQGRCVGTVPLWHIYFRWTYSDIEQDGCHWLTIKRWSLFGQRHAETLLPITRRHRSSSQIGESQRYVVSTQRRGSVSRNHRFVRWCGRSDQDPSSSPRLQRVRRTGSGLLQLRRSARQDGAALGILRRSDRFHDVTSVCDSGWHRSRWRVQGCEPHHGNGVVEQPGQGRCRDKSVLLPRTWDVVPRWGRTKRMEYLAERFRKHKHCIVDIRWRIGFVWGEPSVWWILTKTMRPFQLRRQSPPTFCSYMETMTKIPIRWTLATLPRGLTNIRNPTTGWYRTPALVTWSSHPILHSVEGLIWSISVRTFYGEDSRNLIRSRRKDLGNRSFSSFTSNCVSTLWTQQKRSANYNSFIQILFSIPSPDRMYNVPIHDIRKPRNFRYSCVELTAALHVLDLYWLSKEHFLLYVIGPSKTILQLLFSSILFSVWVYQIQPN